MTVSARGQTPRRPRRLRRDAALEVSDRIVLTLPESEGDVVGAHGEWIKGEVLAVEIRLENADEPTIAKA